MDRAKAIEVLVSHLRQCAMMMPTEWIDKNGSGELMDAFELAFDALKKQAEYEDMEEQGRLVVLPCALEADVFRVGNERVYGGWQVAYAEVYTDAIIMIDDSDNHFEADDIGKTVFLTREEAEQALKGGAENA